MRISISPAMIFKIDNIIVAFLNLSILFALIIPKTPTGIPAKSISMLPQIPAPSNNLNNKLEFKTFVEVVDQQIIIGITNANANSNQKNI